MGYLKGFFTSLAITVPSFLFIEIYLEAAYVPTWFNQLFAGDWVKLMEVCETAIMEPINVFFVSANFLRILFAYLPWVVVAFAVSFFFKKKAAARGGLATVLSMFFGVEIAYYIIYQGGTFSTAMFAEANLFYGFLIINAVTVIVGILTGLISPFKKDSLDDSVRIPRQEQDDIPQPYYMPTESPSRDDYMAAHQQPTQERSRPLTCEFCGSYLDTDNEFCSVCGNRVYNDH